jgi:biotin carboxyl carrier protein
MKKLRVTVDGKVFEVLVEVLDEGAAPAAAVSAPRPAAAVVAPPSSAPKAAAPAGPSGPGDVRSPLAGKVVAIGVKVGDAVAADQQVITLEAMKMNTFINAPKAGTVSAILVNAGDAVEEGQVLLKLS